MEQQNDGHVEIHNFPVCPNCHKGTGLIGKAYQDHVFQDEPAPPGMVFGMSEGIALMNPLKAPKLIGATKIKVLVVIRDICEECGYTWVKQTVIQEQMAQVQMQGPQMPGSQPNGPPFMPR